MLERLTALFGRSSHPSSRWPGRLMLVRHGESAGNVARDAAHSAGHTHIDLAMRDADVPLSDRGREQALALGRWLAERPDAERPDVVLCSPYLRARQTAELVREGGGLIAAAPPPVIDERLREREFGILDRLTTAGIKSLFPEQAEFRGLLGKFYHRPPGGESWCDVILRLRGAVDTLSLHYPGRRVLIVSHEVVVLCLRYLIEEMDEQQILTIDGQGDVANCAVTEYVYRDAGRSKEGSLALLRYNETAPLRQQGAPVTTAADAQAGAK